MAAALARPAVTLRGWLRWAKLWKADAESDSFTQSSFTERALALQPRGRWRGVALAAVPASGSIAPTASVGPQPQATGQIFEVSSVNPNDGQTYSGSATYTVPTTTTTQYDEVDVGIGNVSSSPNTLGTGTVNQTGGTLSLAASSSTSYGQGGLYLGYYAGDTGTYNLSGGTLQAVTESIGYGGTGTFSQTGGNNAVGSGGLFVGNQNTYSGTGCEISRTINSAPS